MINNLSYLSFLNNKLFITDDELAYKYGLNKLLMIDQQEFNTYKEDIKYLVIESLENEGLYRYLIRNMTNKNYVYAINISLIDNDSIIGTIALTKKTYALCLYKLLDLGLSDNLKAKAHNMLSFTTIEECKKKYSSLNTNIQLKDGTKYSINNNDLIDIFNTDNEYMNYICEKNNISINILKLLMLKFASTGILKKYVFNNNAYILENELKSIDISNLYLEEIEKPKLTLNLKIYNKLFDYMNDNYNPIEVLFHVYKQMKESLFSIQTLALIAENLGIEYKLSGSVLEVWYEEYDISFSKERYRIQTSNSSTRNKIYELENKIVENITNNRLTEVKLFNNIAYYKNYYLKNSPSTRDKLITFLRIVSYINTYDSEYINKIKHIYKKVLGKETVELSIITNNIRNKELKRVIPIIVIKYNNTYYVVDHANNIKVSNYEDINEYLKAKEYYSYMYEGSDLLNA
jgi:hypothetical protein